MLRNRFAKRTAAVVRLLTVSLLVQLGPSVLAQTSTTGTLTGTVTDASGTAVANATITASNLDTGQTRTANTGTNGRYKFEALPIGKYRLKFEAANFKALEIPSETVDQTRAAILDEKLEADAQIVNNGKPSSSQDDNLPTRLRAMLQLLLSRISAFLPSRSRATRESRRCSISGRTC